MNPRDERTESRGQPSQPSHRGRRPRGKNSGGSAGGNAPLSPSTNKIEGEGSKEQAKEDKPPPKVPTPEDFKRYEGYAGQKWTGVCKWFNVSKGFGFVLPDHEQAKEHEDDVFVHQSALQMPGFRSLGEGEAIQFTVKIGKRGLEADEVSGIAGAEIQGHTIRPVGRKKDTKIRCYNCGKLSNHKASKCRGPAASSSEKVCYHCQSTDHLLSECPTYVRSTARGARGAKPADAAAAPTAKPDADRTGEKGQPKEASSLARK